MTTTEQKKSDFESKGFLETKITTKFRPPLRKVALIVATNIEG